MVIGRFVIELMLLMHPNYSTTLCAGSSSEAFKTTQIRK